MESYIPMIVAFAMMFISIPVPVCLLGGTFVYFAFISPTMPLTSIVQNLVSQTMSASMLAPAFYIVAGAVMGYAGITERLVDFCNCLLGHKKGGLAYVNVLLSTLNGGMSGSATADAALQCRMLVPEMEKKGYPREFSAAVTAATSLITPIIPPGTPLILYALITGTSIGKMWIGGYIPGFMLCGAMMFVCWLYARNAKWSQAREEKATRTEIWQSAYRASLAAIIPLFMIVGIRTGWFTAVEGGAVLLMLAIGIGVSYKALRKEHIIPILKEAFANTANVMLIVVSACGFSMYLSWERIPHMLAAWMTSVSSTPYAFLALVFLVVFFLGMFLDGTAILMILVPIIFPISQNYGLDPVAFGFFFLVVMYIGSLTPPFGCLMYVTCNLTKVSIPEFCKYSWAFVVCMAVVCVIIAVFPDIVSFIPNLVYS